MFDPETKKIDLASWIDPELYDETEALMIAEPSEDEMDEETLAYYREHGHTPEEHHHRHHNHDSSINTFCLTRDEPMSLDMLRNSPGRARQ